MRLYDWITNLPLDWPNLLIIGGMIALAQFIGIGDLKKRVKRIEEVLHKLTMSFHSLHIKVESNDGFTKSSSPVSLTRKGINLSKKLNAKSIAKKYAGSLKITDNMNEYQIQKACFEFVYIELSSIIEPSDADKIENIAFQDGLEMDAINRVISIELRDFIFQREGRNITEIDKHDPDKSDA